MNQWLQPYAVVLFWMMAVMVVAFVVTTSILLNIVKGKNWTIKQHRRNEKDDGEQLAMLKGLRDLFLTPELVYRAFQESALRISAEHERGVSALEAQAGAMSNDDPDFWVIQSNKLSRLQKESDRRIEEAISYYNRLANAAKAGKYEVPAEGFKHFLPKKEQKATTAA